MSKRDWGWMHVIEETPKFGEHIVHVVPINDSYVHDTRKCWCGPIDDHYEVIHFAADGRQDYEDGIRKPH